MAKRKTSRNSRDLIVTSSRRGRQTMTALTADELPPGASRIVGGARCDVCGSTGPLRTTAKRMVCLLGCG
jgi:hypothetical protein